jgi:hypothetical protein
MSTTIKLFFGKPLYEIEQEVKELEMISDNRDSHLLKLHEEQIKRHIRKEHSPSPEASNEKLILEYEEQTQSVQLDQFF